MAEAREKNITTAKATFSIIAFALAKLEMEIFSGTLY